MPSEQPPVSRSDYLRSLLDAARPTEVYEGTDWIVEAEIPELLSAFDRRHGTVDRIILDAALRDARTAEGARAKSGNAVLREWFKTGQDPLDWQFLGPIPIKVDKKRKCRFDQITPELLEDAAEYGSNVSDARHNEEQLLYKVYRLLVRTARRGGHSKVADVGDGSGVDRGPFLLNWQPPEHPDPVEDDDEDDEA